MSTVRDILESHSGKLIILFLRDRYTTYMFKLECINVLPIDILERKVKHSHVSKFKDTYHIELTV